MSLCSSGIMMAAFTTSLLLADIAYSRADRLIPHLFLGGITTGLFFVICQSGYEMINWAILLAIPIYMLLSLILHNVKHSQELNQDSDDQDECNICRQPRHRCGCLRNEHNCYDKSRDDEDHEHKHRKRNCGISRYNGTV